MIQLLTPIQWMAVNQISKLTNKKSESGELTIKIPGNARFPTLSSNYIKVDI